MLTNDICFDPGGEKIASVSGWPTIGHFGLDVFDAKTGERLYDTIEHLQPPASVAFSHDGQLIATGSFDQKIRFFDAASGESKYQPITHTTAVTRLTFLDEGKEILAMPGLTSLDGAIRPRVGGACVYAVASGEKLREFSADPEAAITYDSQISPDLTRLVMISGKGVDLWNVQTAEKIKSLPLSCNLGRISPNGETLALATSDYVDLYSTASWQRTTRVQHAKRIGDVAFSANSQYLATGSDDFTARVWSVASGEPVSDSLNLGEPISELAFWPNSKYLITAGSDLTRVWDIASGEILFKLQNSSNGRELGGPGGVSTWRGIAISPDGSHFAIQANGLFLATIQDRKAAPHDIQTLAEVMSGYRFDEFGGRIRLKRDELLQRWETLSTAN